MRIARKGRRVYSRHGFCTACLQLRDFLEFHHVVPQRYEEAHEKSELVWLCHDCHLSLHVDWIDPLGRQSRQTFIETTRQFLWERRS
jgi:hypothetical protein